MSSDGELALAIADMKDSSDLRIFVSVSAKPVERQPAVQTGGVPVGETSGKQQTPGVCVCVSLDVLFTTGRLGSYTVFCRCDYKACTIALHFQGLGCFSS
jgi:hypothetical protein